MRFTTRGDANPPGKENGRGDGGRVQPPRSGSGGGGAAPVARVRAPDRGNGAGSRWAAGPARIPAVLPPRDLLLLRHRRLLLLPGGDQREPPAPPGSATAPRPRRHWPAPRCGGGWRALIGCGAAPRPPPLPRRARLAPPRRRPRLPPAPPAPPSPRAIKGAARPAAAVEAVVVTAGYPWSASFSFWERINIFFGTGAFAVPLLSRGSASASRYIPEAAAVNAIEALRPRSAPLAGGACAASRGRGGGGSSRRWWWRGRFPSLLAAPWKPWAPSGTPVARRSPAWRAAAGGTRPCGAWPSTAAARGARRRARSRRRCACSAIWMTVTAGWGSWCPPSRPTRGSAKWRSCSTSSTISSTCSWLWRRTQRCSGSSHRRPLCTQAAVPRAPPGPRWLPLTLTR